MKLRSCEKGNRRVWYVAFMFRSTILLPSSGCKCKMRSKNVTNTLKEYRPFRQPLACLCVRISCLPWEWCQRASSKRCWPCALLHPEVPVLLPSWCSAIISLQGLVIPEENIWV